MHMGASFHWQDDLQAVQRFLTGHNLSQTAQMHLLLAVYRITNLKSWSGFCLVCRCVGMVGAPCSMNIARQQTSVQFTPGVAL